jgi:hypothetical protein
MRKLAGIITLAAVAAQAVTLHPVTLAWTYPDTPPDWFKLYHSTNLTLPLTNWAVIAQVPGTNSDGLVTSLQISIEPGLHFFYLTASNSFWRIESDPSNTANTPGLPARGVLTIRHP